MKTINYTSANTTQNILFSFIVYAKVGVIEKEVTFPTLIYQDTIYNNILSNIIYIAANFFFKRERDDSPKTSCGFSNSTLKTLPR